IDSYLQPVSLRRERTRRIGRKCTRRILGLVEIKYDGIAGGRFVGIQKPTCSICRRPARRVPKDDEKLTVTLVHRFEGVQLSVEFESKQPGRLHLEIAAENIRDQNCFRREILFKFGVDPHIWIDRVPVKMSEFATWAAVRILQANSIAFLAFDEIKRLTSS